MKKIAKLYRMHTEEHICPYGLRSKDLLEQKGFDVEDYKLTSKEETKAFKSKHDVQTTPQTFVDDIRIGGYDALREYFDMGSAEQSGTTYSPVIAIFATAFIMASAFAYAYPQASTILQVVELFVAISMTILAIQKFRALYAFTNSFITYDLLAMRHLRYAYVYPFAEAFVGIGMMSYLLGENGRIGDWRNDQTIPSLHR